MERPCYHGLSLTTAKKFPGAGVPQQSLSPTVPGSSGALDETVLFPPGGFLDPSSVPEGRRETILIHGFSGPASGTPDDGPSVSTIAVQGSPYPPVGPQQLTAPTWNGAPGSVEQQPFFVFQSLPMLSQPLHQMLHLPQPHHHQQMPAPTTATTTAAATSTAPVTGPVGVAQSAVVAQPVGPQASAQAAAAQASAGAQAAAQAGPRTEAPPLQQPSVVSPAESSPPPMPAVSTLPQRRQQAASAAQAAAPGLAGGSPPPQEPAPTTAAADTRPVDVMQSASAVVAQVANTQVRGRCVPEKCFRVTPAHIATTTPVPCRNSITYTIFLVSHGRCRVFFTWTLTIKVRWHIAVARHCPCTSIFSHNSLSRNPTPYQFAGNAQNLNTTRPAGDPVVAQNLSTTLPGVNVPPPVVGARTLDNTQSAVFAQTLDERTQSAIVAVDSTTGATIPPLQPPYLGRPK